MSHPAPIARCSCGATYTAQQWQSLELVGHQAAPASETEPALYIELRNCSCRSTIAVEMDALHAAERAETIEQMHRLLPNWAGAL